MPAKAKLLRNYMKKCGTDIGDFSKTYRFLKVGTSDNPEAMKSVCYASIILQSASSDHQFGMVNNINVPFSFD